MTIEPTAAPATDQAPPVEDVRTVADAKFARDVEILIAEAEETRLRHMRQNQNRNMIALSLGLAAIFCGGAGFGWFFLMQADLLRALACILLTACIPLLLFRWARNPLDTYVKDYKKTFMPRMAQVLGNLKYHPARGISAQALPVTGIVPQHDTYRAEDCFMGRYKNYKIILSEARLRKNNQPAFNGLFVLLEIPGDPFRGHTIITTDIDAVKRWSATRWKDLKKTELQNPDYAGQFSIFSNAPEDAVKLADDALLKAMLESYVLFDNAPLSAAFYRKKHVFITIPYAVDMFEPSNINTPVTTKEHALKCKREMEQIMSVIDILDLYRGTGAA